MITSSSADMVKIEIRGADFDVAAEYRLLRESAPKSGAIVLFVGLVRDLYEDSDQQEHIDHIELSHYAGMTEGLCQQIVAEAQTRYKCDAVHLIHRVGKIYAAEQIVLVGVASRHRQGAFATAQFIMDYLKTRATLWKKEVGARGEHWVGLKDKDTNAAKRWSKDLP